MPEKKESGKQKKIMKNKDRYVYFEAFYSFLCSVNKDRYIYFEDFLAFYAVGQKYVSSLGNMSDHIVYRVK